MANFLSSTKEIAVELERIIKNSKEFICLISYSLKVDDLYIERLHSAAKRGVKIAVVFNVGENKTETLKKLLDISNIQLYNKDNLHAKMYINETNALITSMNLYDYSEQKNIEYGILINKDINSEAYRQARTEIKELFQISKKIETFPQKVDVKNKLKGFCIRCGDNIQLDSSKPLCNSCYNVWSAYANEYYIEDFCHKCGQCPPITETSYSKPLCSSCFYSNKNW